MVPTEVERSLGRAARYVLLAQGLLILASLRHHFVWGESARLPFSLRPLLDALEAGCVVGAAWFGAVGWWRGMAVAASGPGLPRLLRLSWPILLAAMLVLPFLSIDVVDYVMRGRVLALHGGNPYVQVATDYPADPFVQFGDQAWKSFPLPYGPVLANLQGAVAWLAHQVPGLSPRAELVVAVGLFKVLFAAAVLAAALVARSIAGMLQPERRDAAFVGVLWSPLVLGECLGQAHNDALLLLLVLLAVRLLVQERLATGTLAYGGAVLAKIVPAALGPLWLVWAWRRGRLVGFVGGALATVALAGLCYLQFFRDPEALRFLERQSGVLGASPVWLANACGLDLGITIGLGRAAVVVASIVATVWLWRRPTADVLLRSSAGVLAVAAASLGVFGPWYHLWWAPLALLAGDGSLRRFAIAATALSPLGYLVWAGLRRLDAPHQAVMLGLGLVLPCVVAVVAGRRSAVAPTS